MEKIIILVLMAILWFGLSSYDIEEEYKNNPKFCIFDSDCVYSPDGCCWEIVNKYNQKSLQDIHIFCNIPCTTPEVFKYTCKKNTCSKIYNCKQACRIKNNRKLWYISSYDEKEIIKECNCK